MITVMPKRVDLAVQRRMISTAAIAVINKTDPDGARLHDVARAADVTTGAVMHSFDGKDVALEAALEGIARRTLERMETASELSAPGDVEVFTSRVCRYLPTDKESREEWRVWLAFWGRAIADERFRDVHRRYHQKIVERLIEPLRSLRTVAPNAFPKEASQMRGRFDCGH